MNTENGLLKECEGWLYYGSAVTYAVTAYAFGLGRLMSWLCGAAYGTYEDMRYKHFRHHVDMNLPFYKLPDLHVDLKGNAASFLTSF